jgi:hypothetical protein
MADIVFTGQTPSSVIGTDQMPENVDIEIYKGDYYEFFISLQDLNGNPVSFGEDQPKAQLRENYNSGVAVELDCSTTDTGDIRVYLSSAASSTLDADKDYIWDLQTTNYRGDVKTWVTGDVSIENEVTK